MVRQAPNLAGERDASGESPILTALYRGHRDLAAELAGPVPSLDVFTAAALGRTDALERAIEAGHANDIAYDGWTPLHLAAFFGEEDAAAQLLEAGADPDAISRNSMRNTPLHAATAGGHPRVALLLIARRADVTLRDAGGHTPLHIAAENGLTGVVRALLERGADPYAVDGEDKTPMARAAARNRNDIIDLLNTAG
jgi:ankyrin repeat protein